MGISWVMNDSLLMVGGFYRGSLQQPNWLEMIWDFFQWPIINQVRSTIRDYISGFEPCSQWLLVVEPCWTKPLEPGNPSELIGDRRTTWRLGLTVPTEDIEEFVACAPQMQIQVGPLGAVFEAIHLRWFLHLSRLFCSNFIHMKTIVFFTFFPCFFVNLLGISP